MDDSIGDTLVLVDGRSSVDQGLIAVLSEMVILLYRVIQQGIGDVPSRLSEVFVQNRFKLRA